MIALKNMTALQPNLDCIDIYTLMSLHEPYAVSMNKMSKKLQNSRSWRSVSGNSGSARSLSRISTFSIACGATPSDLVVDMVSYVALWASIPSKGIST